MLSSSPVNVIVRIAIGIAIAMVVYALIAVVLRVLDEETLLSIPKGTKMVKLFKKLKIM